MKSASFLVIACAALVGLTACKGTASYNVVALHHDTVREKLDAQWFQRDIYNKQGKLEAVELIYCPMRPGEPTVCRTSVVWRRNQSELVNAGAD